MPNVSQLLFLGLMKGTYRIELTLKSQIGQKFIIIVNQINKFKKTIYMGNCCGG